MNCINSKGLSIIAALFIIVAVAFIGVVLSYMSGGVSQTAVQETSSTQALGLAEAGVEFNQLLLAQNLEWYRSNADPISTTNRTLGAGSFSAGSYVPATMLRRRIPDGVSTAAISAYTTDRFPASGYIQIEDDMASGAEFISYTGIAGNTFTGITRNVTIGGVTGTAGPHSRGDRIYPVTTLITAMGNNCAVLPNPFQITAHTKFLGAGTIDIEGEEISYNSSSTSGGVMTLAGAIRCQNGTTAAVHNAGVPVTPMLVDGTPPDFESEIISTVMVGSGSRVVNKTVQR